MWTRAELKARAKVAMRRNYVKCVIVALILLVILGTTVRQNTNVDTSNYQYSSSSVGQELRESVRSISITPRSGSIGIATVLLGICVFNILEIGCNHFFARNAAGEADLGMVLDGFRESFGRNVLTMFLMKLYIALWSILLVIPGIVKTYAYMLVPYILADSPEMPRREVFALSQQLMMGHKMDAFVLDLSFIGWEILSAITFEILGVFYVNPYVHATKAELYRKLRYGQNFLND